MTSLRPAAFPGHDLDRDLEGDTEDTYGEHVARTGYLHLRFPPVAGGSERHGSQRGGRGRGSSAHLSQHPPQHHEDQLLLSDIGGYPHATDGLAANGYEQSSSEDDVEPLYAGSSYMQRSAGDPLLGPGGTGYPRGDDDDDPLLGPGGTGYPRGDDGDDPLLVLEKELDEETRPQGSCATCVDGGFSLAGRLLVEWPSRWLPGSVLVLAGVLGVAVGMGMLAYYRYPPQRILDDILDDATKGFETRGTDIRKAMSTGEKLIEDLHSLNSSLSVCADMQVAAASVGLSVPAFNLSSLDVIQAATQLTRWQQAKLLCCLSGVLIDDACLKFICGSGDKCGNKSGDTSGDTSGDKSGDTSGDKPGDKSGDKPGAVPRDDGRSKRQAEHSDSDISVFDRVSSLPFNPYMVFVFENEAGGGDMFDVTAVHALCQVARQVRDMFPTHGAFQFGYQAHVGELVRVYRGRDTCGAITQQDVDAFRENLHHCRAYILPDGNASEAEAQLCELEHLELWLDAGTFLVDSAFLTRSNPHGKVRYSNLLVTIQQPQFIDQFTDEQGDFYMKHFDNREFGAKHIRLVAVHFPMGGDLKFTEFQHYIFSDLAWFGLALALVFALMLLYLQRVDMVLATLLSISAGFLLAYCAYYALLATPFFPFINILGLLVLIAIGADDVFVFFDMFEQARLAEPEWPLARVMARALSHAVPSIFVTSFTTAAAFYANAVSRITSVRLFGLFAGTAVLMNFLVMLLVVPAVLVLSELALGACRVDKCRRRLAERAGVLPRLLFSRQPGLPRRVLGKTWAVWLVALGALGLAGCFVVFVKPRFRLPVSADFQLFPSSDPVEHWYLGMRNQFIFAIEDEEPIILYYVWGFHARDPGSHLDPDSPYEHLHMDSRFDFYEPATQRWLQRYCRKVLRAESTAAGTHSAICTLDAYEHVTGQICDERSPYFFYINATMPECCRDTRVPFGRGQLEKCVPFYEYLYSNTLGVSGASINVKGNKTILGHVIYDLKSDPQTTNKVVGFIIPVTTKYSATFEYDVMDKYYKELAGTFGDDIAEGPPSIRGGFCAFRDYFWFYDLQHSLATGTYTSIGLSLGVAFVVMLVTSLNFVITLYAMATIGLAIACTVAVLVLMGWHLNIIESIIISLAVGLSIDFTIHYGVAYRLSREARSGARTCESYERVGAAVIMAALTTFLAGAAMMPCRVLAYTKLGVFLMLVMTFAWLYASLFFQSLCWIVGPSDSCLRPWGRCPPCCRCCPARRDQGRREERAQARPRSTAGYHSDTTPLQQLDASDDDSLLVTF